MLGGINDAVGDIFLDFIIWLSKLSWGILEGAFSITDFNDEANEGLWIAVVGGTLSYEEDGTMIGVVDHPGMLNIVVGAMIPILVIFIALQVIASLVRKSSEGFLRAAVMTVLAIPGTYLAAGMMWFALGATSSVTQWILGAGSGSGDAEGVADGPQAIMSMFGLYFGSENVDAAVVVDEETGLVLDENSVHFGGLENAGTILGAVVVIGLLALAAVFLGLMMIFRLVSLLTLATFLPVAIFGLTWEGAKPIAAKWAQVSIALLISEPAAAVVIRLGAAMSIMGGDWMRIMMGLGLMVVAGIMPLLVMTLVSFMTGGASDSIDRAGSQAGAQVGRAGRRGGSRAMRAGGRAIRRGAPLKR